MGILIASVGMSEFSAIHFLVGFVVVICVLAIVIVAAKWLLSLTGLAIPQPLLVILAIMAFLAMFLWLLNWSGLFSF